MTIRTVSPEEGTGRPYVSGLVARGDLVFVSGQVPVRDGVMVEGSIEAQTEAVLFNIEGILGRVGASLRDVVRCGVYLADLDTLPRFNAVYTRAFDGRLPTRTAVGAKLPGYGVEIDCIAVRPGG